MGIHFLHPETRFKMDQLAIGHVQKSNPMPQFQNHKELVQFPML